MNSAEQIAPETGSRREGRSGLFLAAILNGASGPSPVRIRNLSSGGALIETRQPPAQNENVELVRADHKARASVAWSNNGRCGLKFSKPILVESWIPSLTAESQMAVDRHVANIRQGLKDAVERTTAEAERVSIEARIAEEIAALGRQVDLCLDEMAGFAPLVIRMPRTLQQLEVVSQMLGQLGRLLTAEDPVSLVNQLGMDDLKRRLLR